MHMFIHPQRLLPFFITFTSSVLCLAHTGAPPPSDSLPVTRLQDLPQIVLSATDKQAELASDTKAGANQPVRFAVPQYVELTPDTAGVWENVPNGRLWRLRVSSPGATDLNFAFTTFWLPEGAELYISSETENYYQGPYTAKDNTAAGQLWTPVIPGDEGVVELFVPSTVADQPRLVLTQVGSGYRDMFHRQKDTSQAKAGSCEIDVVCPQAAPWTNEIRSVARYTISGINLCTGTLISDAAGDLRNFFLTANHCDLSSNNAATVVVYWNFQSPTCGQLGGGALDQNQSGAIFRAAKADVDFALIELATMPDPTNHVYYAGWDRSGTAPAGAVGIHHPNGDEKAISFSTTTLTTENSCIGTGGSSTHWKVIWSSGVTEPGSSGSGIWDPATHKLVGTLSGGDSSCSDPTGPDCYGKFSVSWASGKSSSDRLMDWLDPQNTGATSVPGLDPAWVVRIMPGSVAVAGENCPPANGAIDPGELVTVNFGLKNIGGVSSTNLIATLLATNGVLLPDGPQSYGAIIGGTEVARPFTFVANGVCGSAISPVLQLQDGTRNLGQVTFNLTLGVPVSTTVLTQSFDAVVAPAKPAGWTSTISGTGTAWVTTTAQRDTLPNSFFAADTAGVSDNLLLSPVITLGTSDARLSFRHYYKTESDYDGGALEVAVNGGTFVDLISAGGSFLTNGYNAVISGSYSNSLAGRNAWSGDSGGFLTTTAVLPPGAPGRTVQLRWRLGSDTSVGATGWYVDTVSVTQIGYSCCVPPPVITEPLPFHQTNLSFSFNTVTGVNYVVQVKTNFASTNWTALRTNAGTGTKQSFTNASGSAGEFRLRTQ
jgi:hypothetical protein